jgi:phospholipid/cholesterol/gamma-HCH transport system substrate-binding protein
MSRDRKNVEFIVGLTVIGGLLILLFGILWGKNFQLAANQRQVGFLFQNTGGLRVNDPVTVSGVKKGRVKGIQLENGLVRVDVMLDRDVQLFSDVRAYITTIELMGGKKVDVIPGTSGQLLDLDHLREPIRGAPTAGLSEMLIGLSEMAGRTNRLIERLDSTITLASFFLDENTARRPLLASLDDLQSSTATFRELLQTNETKIHRTIANLDYTAAQLRSLMERRASTIDSTLIAFNHTAQKMETLSATLDDISLRLQQREGFLGQLLYDTETFTRLQSTIANIDSTAVELRTSMGQFLNGSNFNLISLFNF